MSNRYDTETFGSITASLNYDPIRVNHHADRAVYVRPSQPTSIPRSLDLADAKDLHAHLGKLIDQIEAGIEAQKSKLPTAFGSVVEVGGVKYVYLGSLWETDRDAYTSGEIQSKDFTVLRDGI